MSAVVEVTAVVKSYQRFHRVSRAALDGMSLEVASGEIHALVGPNGSGKTTLFRVILSLARAQSGSVRVFGRSVPDREGVIADRVGALIESPRLIPSMSGQRNLELLAGSVGLGIAAVRRAIEISGSAGFAHRRFSAYSLGMKQRLGLAYATLKDPELIVLDEPTNGLDPDGVRDVRNLVRQMASEGRTVLVSSHLLSEIEQIADTVTVIERGRRLLTARTADLLTQGSSEISVKVTDLERASGALECAGLHPRSDGGWLRIPVSSEGEALLITRVLAEHDIGLNQLTRSHLNLEDAYRRILGEGGRQDEP